MQMTNDRKSSNLEKNCELIWRFIRGYLVFYSTTLLKMYIFGAAIETKGGEGVKNWEFLGLRKILKQPFLPALIIALISVKSQIWYKIPIVSANYFELFATLFFCKLQVQPQTRQRPKRSSMAMPQNFLMLWLRELCADKRRPFWYLILAKFLDGGTTEMDSWAPEMLSIN